MQIVLVIFLFAIGACVGSFLNVVIWRLPRGQSIVFPPSHCPACGRPIRWHDNIPLVSWLALRGRCRSCRAPISPRYLVIEAATAILVAGLYVCYYVIGIRGGAGAFADSWPTYAVHAALLCSLLVCTMVDIEHWIVPLEVCWFVSVLGVIVAAAAPPSAEAQNGPAAAWLNEFLPRVGPNLGAMSLAASAGLVIANVLMRYGLIQQSFLDADERIATEQPKPHKKNDKPHKNAPRGPATKKITAVAITRAHGVNPRKEILREVLFLAPALVLGIAADIMVTRWPAARNAWRFLTDEAYGGWLAVHVNALLAALFGYLVGGLWIWGMRILGTLAFGKEAMGMGDVHMLAAVGAVTGWVVPSITFFVAPMFGLLWALYLVARRNQRELPYGPWLALATLIVMLFHDAVVGFLAPTAAGFGALLR